MAHEHIIKRLYPGRLVEADTQESEKKRIKKALDEIKSAAGKLPLQAAMDISSAVMDIEGALAEL
jgi:ribosomal protein L16/L10AE